MKIKQIEDMGKMCYETGDIVRIKRPDKNSIIRIKYLINEGKQNYIAFNYDGTYFKLANGECLLFPSKENRDWNKFKVDKPKFDPKTLKPFDKVLVKGEGIAWKCGLFSHIDVKPLNKINVQCAGCSYSFCIPYNEETKHLIGTTEEPNGYYKYW